MLRLVDGRVYDEAGNEVFHLTQRQQDELISQLYPKDDVLVSIDEFTKHSTSYTSNVGYEKGVYTVAHPQNTTLSEEQIDQLDNNCSTIDRVYALGGTRLLTLYCCDFNFKRAADELGMKYNSFVKWFHRWRAKKIALGLTPQNFFK